MPNNKDLFKQLLLMHRRNMGAGNRKRSRRSTAQPNWLFPFSIERKYARGITQLMRSITIPATEQIFDQLDSWISDYELIQGKVDSLKFDSYPEDLKTFINGLRENIDDNITNNDNVRSFISIIGFDVSSQNKKQWGKFSKKLLGIEFVVDEPWETDTINAWGETNFGLIKGLGDEYIKKINTIVSEGIQFGRTAVSMRKEIRKLNKDININRSKLIARDQVGKLHGQLTQRRQEDAGLHLYIWTTAGDERVRGHPGRSPKAVPNHFIMNGKVCKWGDNTVFSDDGGKTFKKRTDKMPVAIPGQEIQCRCTGLAFFQDILEEVDEIIEEEKV